MYSIGPRIKSTRKETGLALEKFAESVDISGGFLSEVERGIKMPGGEIIMRISRTYNKSAHWLLFGEDEPTSSPRVGESMAPYEANPCPDLQQKVIELEKETEYLRGKVEAYERVIGELSQGNLSPPKKRTEEQPSGR